jgi:hypothetical protein
VLAALSLPLPQLLDQFTEPPHAEIVFLKQLIVIVAKHLSLRARRGHDVQHAEPLSASAVDLLDAGDGSRIPV